VESSELSSEQITEQIHAAEERRDRALAEYQAAVEELEWWKQGQRLFASGDDAQDAEGPTNANELFPPGWVFADGTKPTLRQAIVAVMSEAPGRQWQLADLVGALDAQGWLPERSSRARSSKGVADMAAAMATEGHLRRVSRGVYMLSAQLAAAQETARRENFLGRSAGDAEDT
jgi:hypothetical protein